MAFIAGVQFDKHFFQRMSVEEQERFCTTFPAKLERLERYLAGERQAAGNDLKLVRTEGRTLCKWRQGDERLLMLLPEGSHTLTLLELANHDAQSREMRRWQSLAPGLVYYDIEIFLLKLTDWPEWRRQQGHSLSFAVYISQPEYYMLDRDQQAVMEHHRETKNLSIVGNAGSGKSLVGYLLSSRLTDGQALYLTMSADLVHRLEQEFAAGAAAESRELRTTASATWDFLLAAAHRARPDIPLRSFLNAADSYRAFARFWRSHHVDWRSFWKWEMGRPVGAENQDEDSTRLAVWRDLHGIVRGALPGTDIVSLDYEALAVLPPRVEPEEYLRLLEAAGKPLARKAAGTWLEALYEVADGFERYLQDWGLYDDNATARLVLAAGDGVPEGYESVFLDECQDLTQIELAALLSLLRYVPHRYMASDRCQMVQPTYFQEERLRTMANALSGTLATLRRRPFYLAGNHRSSRRIVDFQNFLVQEFARRHLISLRQEELVPIHTDPWREAGVRPIWIKAGPDQQGRLRALCRRCGQQEKGRFWALSAVGTSAVLPEHVVMQSDVLRSKGIEYPAVLLLDVLTDMRQDTALAAKYFYVGATRAERLLLIYESDDSVPEVREVLERAAEARLIDCCRDLGAPAPYGQSEPWAEYIMNCLSEETAEVDLEELVQSLLESGQYAEAAELLTDMVGAYGDGPRRTSAHRAEAEDQLRQHAAELTQLLTYCRGHAAADAREFGQAAACYAELPSRWKWQGLSRRTAVEGLLKSPDLSPEEFISVSSLLPIGTDMPQVLERRYRTYFGTDDFYAAWGRAWQGDDIVRQGFAEWQRLMMHSLGRQQQRLQHQLDLAVQHVDEALTGEKE